MAGSSVAVALTTVQVPEIGDPKALASVRELCEIRDPFQVGTDSLFVRAMRENLSWHSERSPFFRRLLAQAEFSIESLRDISDVARVPILPALFFKKHEVVSVPQSEIELHLTSSGTTGLKSQMFFDGWSIRAPQRMVEFVFRKNEWVSDQPVNYLLYTYEVERDSKLGTAYTDHFLCSFAPAKSVTYALKRTGSNGHEFDGFGVIETLQRFEREGLPARLFGFPAFLHFTLKRMRELKIPPLKLSPQSLVFLGGGWKGNADQAISPEELYREVQAMLGIPFERIRDGFGSVEHCIPYVECRNHHFHVPVWSRVFVRDVKTLEPVGPGKPGFLHFVSPYITSVPAASVLMGDLAEWHEPFDCSCGTPTPYFVILGRAGISKNKSCAVAASELLRGRS